MTYKKKLIEVALPLNAIKKASAREKSIRHGHPSTLHVWWAGLEAPLATSTVHMTNHQPIINPLFVIINLAALVYLSRELISETLPPIWPAGKSSSNRQHIPPNRKPGGQIHR
jgi:hypothetical protein